MPSPHRGVCTGEGKHEISMPYGRKLLMTCPLAWCNSPIEWLDKAAKKIVEDGEIPKEELYEQDI